MFCDLCCCMLAFATQNRMVFFFFWKWEQMSAWTYEQMNQELKRKKQMAATITSAPFRLTKSSVFNEASNAKTRFQIRRRKKWTNIGCFAWMCVFVQILWTFHWMWNLLIYLLNFSRFNQNMHARRFPLIFDWFFTMRYNVSLFLMTTLIYIHTHTHTHARSVDACPSLGPSIYRQTDRHWAMESKQVNYFCCMIALVIADAVDGKYCHRLFHHVCAFFCLHLRRFYPCLCAYFTLSLLQLQCGTKHRI